MSRLRIVSDGTDRGTKITDADTGLPIDGCVAVSWEVGVGSLARVTLELLDVELDVIGEAPDPAFTCEHCGSPLGALEVTRFGETVPRWTPARACSCADARFHRRDGYRVEHSFDANWYVRP